jgi:hypothetical protein
MTHSKLSFFTLVAAAALSLAITPGFANTFHVANNGVDAAGCGTSAHPCRSISKAEASASYGDTILVGPGVYGDLNHDGVLGNSPGEETGSPNCSCMIWINESGKVISTGGAEATILDARTLNLSANVQIAAPNIVFGAAGKGFTITGTGTTVYKGYYYGIYISGGTGIAVAGNQVLGFGAQEDSYGNPLFAVGVMVSSDASQVQIQGNQVIGWAYEGIIGAPQTTISKNTVALNGDGGIVTEGANATGNIVAGNYTGMSMFSGGTVSGNAILGNYHYGIYASDILGTAEQNNIFGNGCGVYAQTADLNAENNYWGAATGPGLSPANGTCTGSAFVSLSPYATTPFIVKAPIVP